MVPTTATVPSVPAATKSPVAAPGMVAAQRNCPVHDAMPSQLSSTLAVVHSSTDGSTSPAQVPPSAPQLSAPAWQAPTPSVPAGPS